MFAIILIRLKKSENYDINARDKDKLAVPTIRLSNVSKSLKILQMRVNKKKLSQHIEFDFIIYERAFVCRFENHF